MTDVLRMSEGYEIQPPRVKEGSERGARITRAEGRSAVSITVGDLERSAAFLTERKFFDECSVTAKLLVKREQIETSARLKLGADERHYFEYAAMPMRAGLVAAIAGELGVARTPYAETRVAHAIEHALAPSWGRVIGEIRRHSADSTALGAAWATYGSSKQGAAVIAVRAAVRKLDQGSLAVVLEARRSGRVDTLPASLSAVEHAIGLSQLEPAHIAKMIQSKPRVRTARKVAKRRKPTARAKSRP